MWWSKSYTTISQKETSDTQETSDLHKSQNSIYRSHNLINTIAKLTIKSAMIGTVFTYGSTIACTVYGIKTIILGAVCLYAGIVDHIVDLCV